MHNNALNWHWTAREDGLNGDFYFMHTVPQFFKINKNEGESPGESISGRSAVISLSCCFYGPQGGEGRNTAGTAGERARLSTSLKGPQFVLLGFQGSPSSATCSDPPTSACP